MFTPEVFYGIGAVVLALAIAWGLTRNRRRNKANDAVTDAAAREAYDNPAAYEAHGRKQDYERQTRPS